MPIQGSSDYTAEHAAAFEGQRANLGLINITSRVAEDGDIAFGRAIVRGTADNQGKLPTATGQALLGISEFTTAWSENASDLHLYQQYREMNIIDFGEVWVYTEQSVVPGDAVYFRHTADTAPLNVIGRFRKDASGSDADLIQGASFETTTAAGGIAKVKLNALGTGILIAPDSSETLTATTSVISVDTGITYFDSTLGAMAASLADGVEGQRKLLQFNTDNGDITITPANYAGGTTIVMTEALDFVEMLFTDSAWTVIRDGNRAIVTVLATGAIPLTAKIVLIDSTSGAQALTLADGFEGQTMKVVMTVDGGDAVITPANLAIGLTLRLTDAFSSYDLLFTGTTWKVIAREGLSIVTITAATTAAMPLDVDLFLFDSTVGASTGALAAGYPGQRVAMKMTVDNGDQVITPALLLDTGTIITFNGTDFAALFSDGTNWLVDGTPTATVS